MLDEQLLRAQPEAVQRMAAPVLAVKDLVSAAELGDPEWLLDEDEVRAITHPVHLVVGGDSDLSRRTDEFVPLLAHVTVNVVPGHDHVVLTSAPREVARHVVPWLEAAR